ncbi:MAG: hypothetical protein JWO74_1614 [Solirubrobacterales bacterium]|nr:hypothetical protein [Solirubrobacterales bacterium]
MPRCTVRSIWATACNATHTRFVRVDAGSSEVKETPLAQAPTAAPIGAAVRPQAPIEPPNSREHSEATQAYGRSCVTGEPLGAVNSALPWLKPESLVCAW